MERIAAALERAERKRHEVSPAVEPAHVKVWCFMNLRIEGLPGSSVGLPIAGWHRPAMHSSAWLPGQDCRSRCHHEMFGLSPMIVDAESDSHAMVVRGLFAPARLRCRVLGRSVEAAGEGTCLERMVEDLTVSAAQPNGVTAQNAPERREHAPFGVPPVGGCEVSVAVADRLHHTCLISPAATSTRVARIPPWRSASKAPRPSP